MWVKGVDDGAVVGIAICLVILASVCIPFLAGDVSPPVEDHVNITNLGPLVAALGCFVVMMYVV